MGNECVELDAAHIRDAHTALRLAIKLNDGVGSEPEGALDHRAAKLNQKDYLTIEKQENRELFRK